MGIIKKSKINSELIITKISVFSALLIILILVKQVIYLALQTTRIRNEVFY
jgi:hypothetical protein